MKYTGWCQNDFNVQDYSSPRAAPTPAPARRAATITAHIRFTRTRHTHILCGQRGTPLSRKRWISPSEFPENDAAVRFSERVAETGRTSAMYATGPCASSAAPRPAQQNPGSYAASTACAPGASWPAGSLYWRLIIYEPTYQHVVDRRLISIDRRPPPALVCSGGGAGPQGARPTCWWSIRAPAAE
jgi:hypothetical protein